MWALPEATSSNESKALTRSPPAKYWTFSRPSVMSVRCWAKRCAPVPRPGKSRGHVVTITMSWRFWEIAGAATVAPATPAAPAAVFLMKLRRCIVPFSCFGVDVILLSFARWPSVPRGSAPPARAGGRARRSRGSRRAALPRGRSPHRGDIAASRHCSLNPARKSTPGSCLAGPARPPASAVAARGVAAGGGRRRERRAKREPISCGLRAECLQPAPA